MRRSFHEQLSDAESQCVRMAGFVLQQLEKVLKALANRDEDLADAVIAADDPIDEVYVDLERRILTLLATQAPVASDLRLVSAILHVNIHLERMGDLCTNIAKFVKLLHDCSLPPAMMDELAEMGAQAGRMIDAAMRAFSARDLELALSLTDMDESIDRLNRRMIRGVVAAAGNESMLEGVTRLVVAARQLERMGDHAVDIGEQVAFMITGEFREFTDASHKGSV
jgi:phosphate transport system protein